MSKVKEFKTNLILPEDEDFEEQVIEKLLPILLGGGMNFHQAVQKILYEIENEDSAQSPNSSLSPSEELERERLVFIDYLKKTDPDLFQAYTNDNTNFKGNQGKGVLLWKILQLSQKREFISLAMKNTY